MFQFTAPKYHEGRKAISLAYTEFNKACSDVRDALLEDVKFVELIKNDVSSKSELLHRDKQINQVFKAFKTIEYIGDEAINETFQVGGVVVVRPEFKALFDVFNEKREAFSKTLAAYSTAKLLLKHEGREPEETTVKLQVLEELGLNRLNANAVRRTVKTFDGLPASVGYWWNHSPRMYRKTKAEILNELAREGEALDAVRAMIEADPSDDYCLYKQPKASLKANVRWNNNVQKMKTVSAGLPLVFFAKSLVEIPRVSFSNRSAFEDTPTRKRTWNRVDPIPICEKPRIHRYYEQPPTSR